MKQLELFVRIDTGTDYQDRWVVNPLFILLANRVMDSIGVAAKLFGIYKKGGKK